MSPRATATRRDGLPPNAFALVALLILILPLPLRAVETITLDALAQHLAARQIHHPLKDKIELRLGRNRRIIFTIFSPIVVVDEVAYRLPHPVLPAPGELRVPRSITRVLGRAVPELASLASATSTERQSTNEYGPLPTPDADSLQAVLSIDRIVIDAGHGGKDPGAVGHRGLEEKDITLGVARELERLVSRDPDLSAVMTRRSDRFLSLGRRARLAREANGDVFISLHCNASKRRAADGLEVYFLSEAKTEAAAAVAARENAVVELEDNGETADLEQITGIRLTLLTSQFLIESQELAGRVRASMARTFSNVDDRGVKQANFYVMRGTMGSMPSVLVEMGFVTNPSEAKRMKSSRYKKEMAKAIYDGLIQFKLTHERQLESTGR